MANLLKSRIYYWYTYEQPSEKHLDRYTKQTHALAMTEDGRIVYAYASCDSRDEFDKKIGRVKAAGRLLGAAQKHYYSFSTPEKARHDLQGADCSEGVLVNKLIDMAIGIHKKEK
jgi:hypothetical protein